MTGYTTSNTGKSLCFSCTMFNKYSGCILKTIPSTMHNVQTCDSYKHKNINIYNQRKE